MTVIMGKMAIYIYNTIFSGSRHLHIGEGKQMKQMGTETSHIANCQNENFHFFFSIIIFNFIFRHKTTRVL